MLSQGGAQVLARLKTTNSIERCLRMQISHHPSQAHVPCGGIQANKRPALVPGSPDPPAAAQHELGLQHCSLRPTQHLHSPAERQKIKQLAYPTG